MAKVLVVEDEMLIRLHVADSLRDHGFSVVEAADGREAIAALQEDTAIAAVFTDVTLPGQPDGFGLAHWVRSHRPGIPVVLTSGEVTAQHAQSVGRDETFFAKPCDYADVAKYIRSQLAK